MVSKKTEKKSPLPFIAAGVVAFVLIAATLALIPRPSKNVNQPLLPSPTKQTADNCVITGCSGELCVDKKDGNVASICIWNDRFACVKYSTCARQKDGKCGWTKTKQYSQCLQKLP